MCHQPTGTLRPAHAHRLERPTHTSATPAPPGLAISRTGQVTPRRTAEQLPGLHGIIHGTPSSLHADLTPHGTPETSTPTVASFDLDSNPSCIPTAPTEPSAPPQMDTTSLTPVRPISHPGHRRPSVRFGRRGNRRPPFLSHGLETASEGAGRGRGYNDSLSLRHIGRQTAGSSTATTRYGRGTHASTYGWSHAPT